MLNNKILYSRLKKICKKQNIAVAKLEKTLHLENVTIGKWQNSVPNVINIK